jgi:hypothetical protein
LRDDWKYFVTTMFKHVMDALSCEKLKRMLGLAKTIEKQWQIMVIIEFFDFNLQLQKANALFDCMTVT